MKGIHIKDLSRLNRDLKRTIIIDNSPESYLMQVFDVPGRLCLVSGLHAMMQNDILSCVNCYVYICLVMPRFHTRNILAARAVEHTLPDNISSLIRIRMTIPPKSGFVKQRV
jgi:hypothetical protein